jgi:hypothetical protein
VLTLIIVVALIFGVMLGAGVTSVLYERNTIGVQRRQSNTSRISQLDVFELPEKMRSSIPPSGRRSESRLPKEPPRG